MTKTNVRSFQLPSTVGFSGAIRVVDVDGQPWFIAADVCKALSLSSHNRRGYAPHLEKLALDQVTHGSDPRVMATWRGSSGAKLVSESGLYKLILRSDKPVAAKFQDWVTRDVLPAIRKDGAYVMGEEKVATGEMSDDEFAYALSESLGSVLAHHIESRGIEISRTRDALAAPKRTHSVFAYRNSCASKSASIFKLENAP